MLKKFVTEKEFNQWVRDMCNSYNNRGPEFNNVRKLCLDDSGAKGQTIIMNVKTGKTAIAKCHKDDEYSPGIGLAVAWAKYRNIPVPIIGENTHITNLNFMDEFYMKRSDKERYQYIGIRKNACGQCVIMREISTGYIYEFPMQEWEKRISSYNGNVCRVSK